MVPDWVSCDRLVHWRFLIDSRWRTPQHTNSGEPGLNIRSGVAG